MNLTIILIDTCFLSGWRFKLCLTLTELNVEQLTVSSRLLVLSSCMTFVDQAEQEVEHFVSEDSHKFEEYCKEVVKYRRLVEEITYTSEKVFNVFT